MHLSPPPGPHKQPILFLSLITRPSFQHWPQNSTFAQTATPSLVIQPGGPHRSMRLVLLALVVAGRAWSGGSFAPSPQMGSSPFPRR
jgi:hypothetical protein